MSRYIGTNDLMSYMFGTTAGTISAIGGTLTPSQMQLLQDCANRAESAIESYTRRNFLGTAGTALYNRYTQLQVANQALYLDQDLFALVGLVNGDTTVIPVGSVWQEPRNEGPPYRILRLKSQYVYVWNTDSDVIVSGTWGFSTVVPSDIVQASVRYATFLYRQKDSAAPGDVAGFQEAGEVPYPRGMPDDVRYLLAPYRSKSGGVV